MHRSAWKQWPSVRIFAPRKMDRTNSQETPTVAFATVGVSRNIHPIELAILLAWLLIEAVFRLAVAALALVLTVVGWRPAAVATAGQTEAPLVVAVQPIPQPIPHPLAALADELARLPVSKLRPLAPASCRRLPKARLVAQLVTVCS